MQLIYTTQKLEEAERIHQCASVYTRHFLGWENVAVCTKNSGQIKVYVFASPEEALQKRLKFGGDKDTTIWYSIDHKKIEAFKNTLTNISKVARDVSLSNTAVQQDIDKYAHCKC